VKIGKRPWIQADNQAITPAAYANEGVYLCYHQVKPSTICHDAARRCGIMQQNLLLK
jgi:hypothetical protein